MKTISAGSQRAPRSSLSRVEPIRKTLLLCGIGAVLLYVAMLVIAAALYPGYSSSSQTVSELSAIGSPTRQLWILLGFVYSLLVIAFGWGVWLAAGNARSLRTAGVALAVSGILGFFWPPMHQREVIAAGGGTLTDTLHIAWTIAWGMFSLLLMILGGLSFGKRFRLFTIATILVLLAFGILTSLDAPKMQANLPTPWMGIWERINIGAFVAWMIVFAIVLLRVPESESVKGNAAGARTTSETEVNGFCESRFRSSSRGLRRELSQSKRVGRRLLHLPSRRKSC